jgi:hypothetical protein
VLPVVAALVVAVERRRAAAQAQVVAAQAKEAQVHAVLPARAVQRADAAAAVVAAAHARHPAARAAQEVDAAARKAVLKVGAGKERNAGKGLAISVAEAVGRGAARITNVISSLTGKSDKRR